MKGIAREGFRGGKLKISGRKDWIIFWSFAAIIAYVAGGWMGGRVDRWLERIAGPWIMRLNLPPNYGRTIVATLLLTLLAEGVLFLCRRPAKAKLGALVLGMGAMLAVTGIHQIHCQLIVSSLWEEEPDSVWTYRRNGDGLTLRWGMQGEAPVSEEECQELLALCRSLEVISDPYAQESCMAWYQEKGNLLGADEVYLTFPQKYGHSYVLDLRIQEGHVYLWRGYKGQEPLVTFFQDNGIVAWLYERQDQRQEP